MDPSIFDLGVKLLKFLWAATRKAPWEYIGLLVAELVFTVSRYLGLIGDSTAYTLSLVVLAAFLVFFVRYLCREYKSWSINQGFAQKSAQLRRRLRYVADGLGAIFELNTTFGEAIRYYGEYLEEYERRIHPPPLPHVTGRTSAIAVLSCWWFGSLRPGLIAATAETSGQEDLRKAVEALDQVKSQLLAIHEDLAGRIVRADPNDNWKSLARFHQTYEETMGRLQDDVMLVQRELALTWTKSDSIAVIFGRIQKEWHEASRLT